jgi:hypothetical protein
MRAHGSRDRREAGTHRADDGEMADMMVSALSPIAWTPG